MEMFYKIRAFKNDNVFDLLNCRLISDISGLHIFCLITLFDQLKILFRPLTGHMISKFSSLCQIKAFLSEYRF